MTDLAQTDDPAPTAPPRLRRRWLFALKALFSAALILWVLRRADLGDVFASLTAAHLGIVLAAGVLIFVGSFVTALRWGGLLRSRGVAIRLPVLYRSCLVAIFVRQFLPSTVGGDAIRVYDSWRGGASRSTAVTTLVVDRLVGLLTLALVAVVAIAFARELTGRYPALLVWAAAAAVFMLAVTWLVFMPRPRVIAAAEALIGRCPTRIQSMFRKLFVAVTAFRGETGVLGRALALSVLLQTNVIAFYYLLSLALGLGLAFHHFLVIVPIAVFVILMPITINGIGLREGVFAVVLGAYGVELSDAIAFAWLEYGVFLAGSLVGGVIYALRRDFSHPS